MIFRKDFPKAWKKGRLEEELDELIKQELVAAVTALAVAITAFYFITSA